MSDLYNVNDWIVIRTDNTDEFVADHYMTGNWNESISDEVIGGIVLYRKIMEITEITETLESETKNLRLIKIDAPTRYFMFRRDNARIY